MASTFSPSLKLELIGDGDQSGIWGQTTNTNLGTLLEQAITGVVNITMVDANYTLTSFNGVSDEARNAVLVVGGTNNAVRDIIAPLVEKLYVIKNSTSGGYAINIRAASGSSVSIPNGATVWVYCDGTNFNPIGTESIGNFDVNGNLTVSGTTTLTGALSGSNATFSGAISSVSPAFTGTPTAPTAANGTNTTQIATTAFVNSAVTIATGSLGTMSTQNANSVAITGGNISVANVTSTNQAKLVSSGNAIRPVTIGTNEIAIAQSGNPVFLNICDANGNNGNTFSMQIRGLISGGAAAANLSTLTLAANSTDCVGALTYQNGTNVAPRPNTVNLGTWIPIGAGEWNGSGWVIPGGGTWAWFISNRGGGYAGIAAGGSVVAGFLGSPSNNFGFVWNIA